MNCLNQYEAIFLLISLLNKERIKKEEKIKEEHIEYSLIIIKIISFFKILLAYGNYYFEVEWLNGYSYLRVAKLSAEINLPFENIGGAGFYRKMAP